MKQKISIIGVPMDLGQMRRGVDMGPSAVRYADLNERLKNLNYDVTDEGDIKTEIKERADLHAHTSLKNI